jgi:hypothetical protein
MLAGKLLYVAIHFAYLGWQLFFMVVVIGSLAWAGTGPSHGRLPPPKVSYSAQQFVWFATAGATFLCVILPWVRRRLDLIAVGGSFLLAALLWVEVAFESVLDHGDVGIALDEAVPYSVLVAAPFVTLAVVIQLRRRREVAGAIAVAKGPCPGCQSDRSVIDALAPCPECHAASPATILLEA